MAAYPLQHDGAPFYIPRQNLHITAPTISRMSAVKAIAKASLRLRRANGHSVVLCAVASAQGVFRHQLLGDPRGESN